MAINTIYQLRLNQAWGATNGKPQENVFFFNHAAGTGLAADLANAFGTSILPAINAIQATVVKNISINVINLGDLSDFAEPALSGAGSISADALPPYAAVGFTLKVNTRAVRKGSKRFSGVPETVQTAGDINDAGYRTSIEALRLLLMGNIVSGGDTWIPVVVKRVKTAVVGTVPLEYRYRLPTSDMELVTGNVVVALTTDALTHQVSREV